VTVDGQLISTIGKGLLVFAAIGKDDTPKEVESMANKILKVKLWDGDDGKKWKNNVKDIDGEVLCGWSSMASPPSPLWSNYGHELLTIMITVSQFTLLASTKKGNKPDFHKSAKPAVAKELYDQFFNKMQSLYSTERVKDGVFQAMMDVALINDGPVGVDYCCEDGAVNPQRAFSKFCYHRANVNLRLQLRLTQVLHRWTILLRLESYLQTLRPSRAKFNSSSSCLPLFWNELLQGMILGRLLRFFGRHCVDQSACSTWSVSFVSTAQDTPCSSTMWD